MARSPANRWPAVPPLRGGEAGYIRAMIEWSEMHVAIRDEMRRFVQAEIKPKLEELEHGDTPPYEILRKLVQTFGLKAMAEARFAHQIAREKARAAAPASGGEEKKPRRPNPEAG